MGSTFSDPGAADGVFLRLQGLYRAFGYTRYRMGRFEEYDLYAKNRSFITGSSILTFTDTDGRLMALKPDVTLSVIKNTAPSASLQKLYYRESVYRAADAFSGFSEIQQAGLECLGKLDMYSMAEVVTLAAMSLEAISDRYMLDLTHLGLLGGFFEDSGVPEGAREELTRLAGEKNSHEAGALCRALGLSQEAAGVFLELIHLRAPLEDGVRALSALPLGPTAASALSELARLAIALRGVEGLWLDLSLRADPGYYNGVVMHGFIPGVPTAVLSGGRYDGLVRRLGRDAGAMGFAIYLNLLERLMPEPGDFDADLLLLDDGSDPAALLKKVRELTASGLAVRVDCAAPEGMRFRGTARFSGGELIE